MTPSTPREHVLFVHAHPDDETITTGGTMATLVDAGSSVTLVTCTRGERGEVVPPELQHLSGDEFGSHRESELSAAMRVLGVTDIRFLGSDGACAAGSDPHRYRDSGMAWGPKGPEPLPTVREASGPASLTDAPLDAVIADIAAVMEDIRPTAVVSYDERGGYGHPDHVRTQQAARIAALMMDVPFYEIVPAGEEAETDLRVDVGAAMDRKKRALQAHRTQLTVVGDTIVHSGGQVEEIRTVEVFRLGGPQPRADLDWRRLGPIARIATCSLALLLGGAVGAVGTAGHQYAFAAPSMLLSTGLLAGLRLLFGIRAVAALAALGLLLTVGAFSLKGPGGAVLIQDSAAGFIWTYSLPVIALVVLAWPRLGSRSRDTMVKEDDPEKVVGAS